MANIVKKNEEQQAVEWSPLRAMRSMMHWDPFREMSQLTHWDPFRELSRMMPLERAEWSPHFDVTESKDAYTFKVDVPGVKKEDLEISVTGNRIQISGKREAAEETKSDTVYAYERQYGGFVRSFTLPDGADLEHAKSELKEGVLTLVIPKTAAVQPKQISISTSGAKS
ncbi:MAG TPA: Hsp20/alpha crystallin family protein [Kofleriaceae bacterium]|nr:Hsp20/alpha crystallin family protein [Kofleriaceae bacterium]